MISWITASHRQDVLDANLAASLLPHISATDDELIVIPGPASIAQAYNRGAALARHQIRCYVHHDVVVRDPAALRASLLEQCTPEVGMVGVIGSRTVVLPWWEGDTCGSVIDARMGLLDFGPGGECALLDGLLLATCQQLTWDETIPGWHGYDHDACLQMGARGLPNWCLPGGGALVLHNTAGPTDTAALTGWDTAMTRLRDKWGDR